VRTKEKSISLPATPQQHTPEAPQFHAQRVGIAGGELSSDGNPEFATVLKVIRALGFRLHPESAAAD
jgi:hypothetical protein